MGHYSEQYEAQEREHNEKVKAFRDTVIKDLDALILRLARANMDRSDGRLHALVKLREAKMWLETAAIR